MFPCSARLSQLGTMDVVALVASLQGHCLRRLCLATGESSEGLAIAARRARRAGFLDAAMCKRMERIDVAAAIVRHINLPKVQGFKDQLDQALAQRGGDAACSGGAVSADKPQQSQQSQDDAATDVEVELGFSAPAGGQDSLGELLAGAAVRKPFSFDAGAPVFQPAMACAEEEKEDDDEEGEETTSSEDDEPIIPADFSALPAAEQEVVLARANWRLAKAKAKYGLGAAEQGQQPMQASSLQPSTSSSGNTASAQPTSACGVQGAEYPKPEIEGPEKFKGATYPKPVTKKP